MYFKYDDVNDLLLVAAEDHLNTTLEDNEGIGLYVDDDASGTWSTFSPGSEGNYWIYYYSTGATLRYRSLSGGDYAASPYYTFTNPQIGFSTAAGYMTVEAAIPLGFRFPYQIALYGPEKAPGLAGFVASRDAGNPIFHGWWPQNTPSIVENPNFYAPSSIQATLPVPPASPDNVTAQREGQNVRVTWTDPMLGLDNLPVNGMIAMHIYRNDVLFDIVDPDVESFLDETVISGGWYEYSIVGFIMLGSEEFEGAKSTPVGIYAGEDPQIRNQIWDDGSWEQFTVVDFSYDDNRFGVMFDAPDQPAKVYTVELATNQTGPIGIAIAGDDAGSVGDLLAGPFYLKPPVVQEFFTFHFPELSAPLVDRPYWVILYWAADSPGNPGIATDVSGEVYSRSYTYKTSTGWVLYTPGNWMIRAGIGEPIDNAENSNSAIVHQFRLMQNYPNPFNPSTMIPYELAANGKASLAIYNLLGQKVTTLVDEIQTAGYHITRWNGCNAEGNPVSSGVYVVRLEAVSQSAVRKIALVK
jgi:hypothetical protein